MLRHLVSKVGVCVRTGIFLPEVGGHQAQYPSLEIGVGIGVLHKLHEVGRAFLAYFFEAGEAVFLHYLSQYLLMAGTNGLLLGQNTGIAPVCAIIACITFLHMLVGPCKAIQHFAQPDVEHWFGLGKGWQGAAEHSQQAEEGFHGAYGKARQPLALQQDTSEFTILFASNHKFNYLF